MTSQAEMWKSYAFQGFTVVVIQRWNDPFGMPMVRIADVGDEDRAEGMPEAVFLAQASPLPASS
ncbi:hypothetical protein [Bradyrhizobium commune]|uniref:Uncharacterized protein n=1 Tax=Bradyrhizobium commune TaxID=83627 RepID=A0A7S9D6Z1_9BRAD|nr:hypothetical protein [Bradyrhizobium commune]QPF92372.1 hypothetical protein IC761_03480 [Bradyrhizobium commune]